MALKLMYITNNPRVAEIAQNSGVERIFIDMEYIGKDMRQGGMDTVQNHHTIEDIQAVRKAVISAEIITRINPIHEASSAYCSSEEEINAAIQAGSDILMLPFFKKVEEVREFLRLVNGRVKTMALLETPEAVDVVDEILELPGLDEMLVGLNDLSLGYGKKFMFELLADGTVEKLCSKFKQKGIPYGFGGIGRLGQGMLPAEYIIREHYRLGSTCVILSRSFCDVNRIACIDTVKEIFTDGVRDIRNLEIECQEQGTDYFEKNHEEVVRRVHLISRG